MLTLKFEDSALEDLYNNGKTDDKRYKKILNSATIKKYIKTVNFIKAIVRRSDLFKMKGLNYECLEGSDKESVRIDLRWRLIFKSIEDDKLIIERIEIYEISNHYGDN